MSGARRALMAGNWKMNLTHRDVSPYLDVLLRDLSAQDEASEVVLLPPFTAIPAIEAALHRSDGTRIAYGAQDLSPSASGAFTGDIGGAMLRSLGCTYVLVGHSERRQVHGEDDNIVHTKVQAAFREGLVPIICVGEALDIRRQGNHVEYTLAQVRAALADVREHEAMSAVIAYEPIWAIGTGEVATPADAQEVCAAIRGQLHDLYSPELAQNVRILYGGSVTPATAQELVNQPDVDGALVGGASLNPGSFAAICQCRSGESG